MPASLSSDPVLAVVEKEASGSIALIFGDIRKTLKVDVVNLIWRHLATTPDALEWVWNTVKPLYKTFGPLHADQIRGELPLPVVPAFSRDTLLSAGLDDEAIANVRLILDSYHHTNAPALAILSGFLARLEGGSAISTRFEQRAESAGSSSAAKLPPLIPIAEMPVSLGRLVQELNVYGEDTDHIFVPVLPPPRLLAVLSCAGKNPACSASIERTIDALVEHARHLGEQRGLALLAISQSFPLRRTRRQSWRPFAASCDTR